MENNLRPVPREKESKSFFDQYTAILVAAIFLLFLAFAVTAAVAYILNNWSQVVNH